MDEIVPMSLLSSLVVSEAAEYNLGVRYCSCPGHVACVSKQGHFMLSCSLPSLGPLEKTVARPSGVSHEECKCLGDSLCPLLRKCPGQWAQ
jgi:hypothetical protein